MTLNDIKNYLRIDFEEDDTYLTELLEVAQIYIDSMVGETYKTNEKAVKLANLLLKKLVNDMYENRGTEIPQNTKKDVIVSSILDKLSLIEEVV